MLKGLKNHQNLYYLGPLFIIFYSIGYFLFGERLPVAGGLGWDGIVYGAFTKDFWGTLKNSHDVYHLSRILPSFIINLIARICHIKLQSPHSIWAAFYIYNGVLFFVSALLWRKICIIKKFNPSLFWLGFISLYISYFFLKFYQYDAVVTDTSAFFLGMLALYLYINKKFFMLALTIIPIGFTWPIALVFLFPLLVLPNEITKNKTVNPYLFAIIAAFLFILVSTCLIYTHGFFHPTDDTTIQYGLLPLSIFISTAYIYFVIKEANPIKLLMNYKKIHYKNLFLYLSIIFVYFLIYKYLLHSSAIDASDTAFFSVRDFIRYIILESIAKPGLFIISHIIFFGSIIVLLVYRLKKTIHLSSTLDLGMACFLILTLIMALDSESRQLSFSFPFVVYLVCLTYKNQHPGTKFMLLYLVSNILLSKVYYLINVAPLTGSLYDFPLQRFFMNLGPWMAWPGYFLNLALALVAFILISLGLKYTKQPA